MAVLSAADSIRFLSEAGRTLAESLDPKTTLEAVARLAVPRLADWLAIHQVEADGAVRRVTLSHPDPGRQHLLREMETRYPIARDTPSDCVQSVLRTGRPLFLPEIHEAHIERAALDAGHLALMKAIGMRSSMVVPLVAHGRVLGALSLILAESGRRYDEEDLLLATELAHNVALALDNARLHAEAGQTAERLRMAEKEVRDTRDLLQTALDTLADTVTVMDTSGRILFANEAQARSLGFAGLREMQSYPVGRLPERVEAFREDGSPMPAEEFASRQALSGATVRQRIIRTRLRSTGEEHWYEVHATPVLDPDGKVKVAITGAHDITRLKRAEEALRAEQEKLRLALDAGRIGTWEWEMGEDRVVWSDRIYAIHGMEPGSFGGSIKDFAALVHPEDFPRVQEAIAKAMAERSTYEVEFRAVKPSGEIQWIYTSARFQMDPAGAPIRMLGVTVDITDRRRTEEALRRSEERYRHLTENVPQLIWMNDAEGEAVFFNRQWEDYTGRRIRPEDFAANRDLVHPEDLPRLLEIRAKGLAEGAAYSHEYRLRRHDGRFRWHLGKVVPLRDATGRIESWLGTATDIHDLRTAQEENLVTQEKLRQSQKVEAVGRLAGGVAHDFNNLLTAINGYSDILLAQMSPGHEHRAFITEIRQAGERAASLTRQLLAYSRRQILNPKVTDLNGIVEGMSNMLRRLIGETIRLETVQDPGLAKVKVDQGQIEQVILNLAINARDAMPEGGELAIRVRDRTLSRGGPAFDTEIPPGDYVELEMADTGHGMDEGVLSRLFEPFFTTKEVGKGTGLGLSMVQGIVRQSGGYIQVESAPGRGSVFRILLPAVEEKHGAGRREAGRAPGPEGLKAEGESVLLVEDEAPVRRYVREILERAGYRVVEAGSGAEALDEVRRTGSVFQLLVSDVVMPGMMGPHLAGELRKLLPGIRVLFMSGYSELSILEHPELDEKTNFLQKPFPPADLLRKAREILAARAG